MAKFFSKIFTRSAESVTPKPDYILPPGATFTQLLASRSKPMLLSTVYRCVDLISDSVAMLPLETYSVDAEGFKTLYRKHPAYKVLNATPNENMTRFTLFKTLLTSVLLTGNGYALIVRDSQGNAEQLIYLPSSSVTIVWVDGVYGNKVKRYRVAGIPTLVEPNDMLHILNFSYDGINGISTLTHARQTLDIATASEESAAGFFEGGGNLSGVLTVEGARVDKMQKEQIYEEWEKRTNPVTGKPNGIVVLNYNMKYQPIQVNPKDSQLLESRQYNVSDICRFFSVSPVKAFDMSKSSYSTVEATQLAFLTDTITPIISKIELEINRKVFLPSEGDSVRAEFNTNAFLRADKTAQANYFRTMFAVGAATPNEIRRENNFNRLPDGDHAFVQVNMQTLERAVVNPIVVSTPDPNKEE